MKKLFLILLPVLIFSFGCKESDEISSIFAAQQCYDKVDESDEAAVRACGDAIASLNSAEALSVRCKILLTAGGLTSTRMLAAMDSQSGVNSGAMMLNFSFNTAGDNKNLVKQARQVCEGSGDRGLVGLASYASMGTLICNGASSCVAASPTDVTNKINDCVNNDSTCDPTDKEELGAVAEVMGSQYCSGGNATLDQCSKLETAKNGIPFAEGSPKYYRALADNLMGQLKN